MSELMKPKLVRASEKMGRNELCWCGSGKKYKHCHSERSKKPRVNLFEIEDRILNESAKGFCLYPNKGEGICDSSVIKAHTVQKMGGLSAIAEEGHVLTVKPSMKGMLSHDGFPPPRRIGISKASVFPGFCNKHDFSLFQYIEGSDLEISKEAAFLFGYRAVSYEFFAKTTQVNSMPAQRLLDSGEPLWKQEVVQNHLNMYAWGAKLGLRDVTLWKQKFDALILSNNYNDVYYAVCKFDGVLPFVGCGALFPEYDFDANVLQVMGRGNFLELLTINITVYKNASVAVFCWLDGVDGPSAKLVRSLLKLGLENISNGITRLFFEHSENIYLRPSWWNSLDGGAKYDLGRRILSGGIVQYRTKSCLADVGVSYSNIKAIEFSHNLST